MRILFVCLAMLASAGVVFHSTTTAQEKKAEKKEVTLKGKITCGKCDLGVDKACATVIVAKVKDKETVYYFDPAGHKKWHSDVCSASKPGSVTGTVSKEGKKYIITVKDVKYD